MSVAFRIRCCLCAKNIPLARDVIALDGEWQRRYPDMHGTLACERCIGAYGWNSCTQPEGGFVDGHIAAPGRIDIDAWCHHLNRGTHRALVTLHPRSGLLQGAEPYLRSLAARRGTNPETAAMLRTVIQEWEEQQEHSHPVTRQPATA